MPDTLLDTVETDVVTIVRRGLTLFATRDGVIELRVLGLDARKQGIIAGYFDDKHLDELASEACRLDAFRGANVYVTLNPANAALLARISNCTKRIGRCDALTSDTDIQRRRWLFVDVDPVRLSKIPATDAEHAAALVVTYDVCSYLEAKGVPPDSLVSVDSGNGAYVLIRVDLPNDQASLALAKRINAVLALRFEDGVVCIDGTVVNAARILRLPGTTNRKGGGTHERPHRPSGILRVPDEAVICPIEVLEHIATSSSSRANDQRRRRQARVDVVAFVAEHFPDARGPLPWGKGHKWLLPVCPWNPVHAREEAFILQFDDGGVDAGCLHNSCADKTWADMLTSAGCADGPGTSHSYIATDDGFFRRRATADGIVDEALTNFTASLTTDVQRDDGADVTRVLELQASLHHRSTTFLIPADKFMAMNWHVEHLGAKAVIFPGAATRDHARTAIQLLSENVPTRVVYTYTGWRLIDDAHVYLHGGGAIGPNGLDSSIVVDLAGKLAAYRLPSPPEGEARTEAVRASLELLKLGPLSITFPVVACAYLAPLCTLLSTVRPDFVAWLYGGSGLFKSEVATLVQAHYGEFSRTTLPASFEATANSVERMLFAIKDSVLVVDDFHPCSDIRQAQAMAASASRLLRGVGNGAGRSRMRPDTSIRTELTPRGLAVATGEHLPTGHSNLARLFPVPFEPGAIDIGRLTTAQAKTDLLRHSMAAFVQYLAQNWESLARKLPARFEELRAVAQAEGLHRREPGQIAHLTLGMEIFLRFAVDTHAIDDRTASKLLADGSDALRSEAAAHAIDLAEETPVQRFLALLHGGFVAHKIYVEDVHGGPPTLDPEIWGWERNTEDGEPTYRHPAGAARVGWVTSTVSLEDAWLLLHPDTAYQWVTTAARSAGELFPVTSKSLLKHLADEDVIAVQEDGKRRTVQVRINGIPMRVIKLRVARLYPDTKDREQREQREQRASMAKSDELVIQ